MNCSEVLLELESIADLGEAPNQSTQAHVDSCESCGLVLSEHLELKKRLRTFIADIKIPAQLSERLIEQLSAQLSEPVLNNVWSQDNKLGDFLEDSSPGGSVTVELLREDIIEVINGLSAQERDVLRLRFGLDDGQTRTLEEVGKLFGCTREEIRMIEARALRLLRHPNRSRRLRYLPPPPPPDRR